MLFTWTPGGSGLRRCLLLLCLACWQLPAFSQSLPPLKVTPFSYNPGHSQARQADEIGRTVGAILTNSGRFSVLADREMIDEELERQKDGIYLNGYMVEQGKALGAQYILIGHLVDASQGADYATVELAVVDVETGAKVAVEVLSPSGRETTTIMDASEFDREKMVNNLDADNATLGNVLGAGIAMLTKKTLERNVNDFLDEYFPASFLITGMETEGNAVSTLELYGYQAHEFRKGETFTVVDRIPRENPDGTVGVQVKEVAKVKVVDAQGDYAQCKVSKKEQEALFEKKDAKGLTVIK